MTKLTIFDPNVGDRPANLPLTNNYAATAAPGVGNDSSQGYEVGSAWVNTTTKISYVCVSAAVGAAVWQVDGAAAGQGSQGAPTALTVSATLTAAQIATGILTANQGAAGAAAYQLPLATAMDSAAAFAAYPVGGSFDFSLINISTDAAEDATITTNTGWTLVGSMAVQSNDADTSKSAGRFRARKTAAGAWTLYRIS